MSEHRHIYVCKVQPPSVCQLCGKTAELRPYGPNGESICHDCGMKDIETTKRQFLKEAFGEEQ